ncbi:hypothetical protein BJ170DRAFT_680161 [Xylariales sp. AK1849]|nr:hypothetical protein BJ170DRAFT_680161 [Xylariales sp. AK1849]
MLGRVHGKSEKLNIHTKNAGVRLAPRTPLTTTEDVFEVHFETNYLIHFLLLEVLKDVLLQFSIPDFNSCRGTVASAGHRRVQLDLEDINTEKGPSHGPTAFDQSRLANMYACDTSFSCSSLASVLR